MFLHRAKLLNLLAFVELLAGKQSGRVARAFALGKIARARSFQASCLAANPKQDLSETLPASAVIALRLGFRTPLKSRHGMNFPIGGSL